MTTIAVVIALAAGVFLAFAQVGWRSTWERRTVIARRLLRQLWTYLLLVLALTSGGRFALATIDHQFGAQLLASLSGAMFGWLAIVRLIEDFGGGDK